MRIRPVSGGAGVEGLGHVHGFLAGGGVGHEERFDRLNGAANLFDFVHHRVIQLQAAGGIDDDVRVGVADAQFKTALGNLHRAGIRALLVHGHVNLHAERLQLGDGRRTVGVGRH